MRRWFSSTILCILVLALAGYQGAVARAPDAPDGPNSDAPPPPAESITLPGTLSLGDLVELVSQKLNVAVQFERDQLSKSVALRLPEPLTDEELWQVLTAVLAGHGLVVIETERPGLYRVVPVAQAAAENRRMTTVERAPESRPTPPSYTSVLVRVNAADPQALARDLAPLLTPNTGSIRPIGDTGLLLVSDVAVRVERVIELITALDGPPDPMARVVVDLQHLSSIEAARMIEQVLAAESSPRRFPAAAAAGAATLQPAAAASGVRVMSLGEDRRLLVIAPSSRLPELRELITQLDQREPAVTQSYTVAGVSPQDLAVSIRTLLDTDRGGARPGAASTSPASASMSARIAPELLTGTVLVTATAAEHRRIADLVRQVESSGASSRRVLRSFTIRNRDAVELSSTLSELLAAGDGSALQIDGPSSGSATSVAVTSSGAPAPSPSTDTAGTTPGQPRRSGPRSEALSVTVDQPTNTLLVAGEQSLVSQAAALIEQLDQRQPQVMIEVTLVTLSTTESLDFGVELRTRFESGQTSVDLASLFGLASSAVSGGPLAAGTGLTGIVVRPGDYEVVVRALETLNKGRAMSMPKILVNNNAKGSVRSVNRQPFTSINASNTVSTTSFGGTQDAGTTISVEPRITRGDHLVLGYSVELSAFTGQPTIVDGGGIVPPPSQQNSVEGTVTLPDGYTVVVGGLSNSSEGKSNSRIPILGSIPLLGALFGTSSESDNLSRFYVFIRATVLRAPLFEDLRQISAGELAEAGLPSDAPPLRPLWVD